jgi:hypothetical protein
VVLILVLKVFGNGHGVNNEPSVAGNCASFGGYLSVFGAFLSFFGAFWCFFELFFGDFGRLVLKVFGNGHGVNNEPSVAGNCASFGGWLEIALLLAVI